MYFCVCNMFGVRDKLASIFQRRMFSNLEQTRLQHLRAEATAWFDFPTILKPHFKFLNYFFSSFKFGRPFCMVCWINPPFTFTLQGLSVVLHNRIWLPKRMLLIAETETTTTWSNEHNAELAVVYSLKCFSGFKREMKWQARQQIPTWENACTLA